MIVLTEEERFGDGWSDPTLTRDQAGDVYGREIPPEAWAAICDAFRAYTSTRQDRAALRPVKGKSRPESWFRAHDATLRTLDAAIEHACKATRERKLWQGQGLEEERAELDAAVRQLIDARRAIDDLAPPVDPDLPSEGEAKKQLARGIRDALDRAGLDVRRTGGSIRELRGADLHEAEMTPFEHLCRAFGLGRRGQTAAAFVEWLREN
jgi:hypothetical protein